MRVRSDSQDNVATNPELVVKLLLPTLALLLLAGCGNAVQSGHSTALDSLDLTQMTDGMAASIAGSAPVQQAIAAHGGSIKVVVQPVENEMTAEILPRGQADMFTARVRYLLSQHNPSQFTWIMNRDTFYELRKRELEMDLGPAPQAINPEYALTAHFRTLTHENSKMRSSAYLCVYELSSLMDRTVLWTDKYEVKKTAVKGFLD
jgi:ABC-type glycerol-3-phosphate transport system substrate-binding protein